MLHSLVVIEGEIIAGGLMWVGIERAEGIREDDLKIPGQGYRLVNLLDAAIKPLFQPGANAKRRESYA
jgi:hypothetical protein